MRNLWLIATTTYRRRIRSGTFLFLTFGIPLLMVAVVAVPLFGLQRGRDFPPLGYVDQTGRLGDITGFRTDVSTLNVTRYEAIDAARTALDQGTIAGYLVVPEGYFDGESVTFYGEERPSAALEGMLSAMLRQAIAPRASPATLDRFSDPSELTYVAVSTGQKVSQGLPQILRFATPALLAVVFALAVFTGANQLGTAVVREKDQRAMEMVITSLSPWELVTGKVVGMTLLSLTQVTVWLFAAVLAVVISIVSAPTVPELVIPWRALIWGPLLGIPGYFFYAVLAAGLGIIAGDSEQARQLAGMLGFVGLSPLYFLAPITSNPNGPIALALTFFPLTGPIIGLVRMVIVEVPTWQLATAAGILLVSLAAGIWAVTRVFRAAMLLYGQTLRPKQILQALSQS